MLKVSDMSPAEMHALLQRESFGHLGCARDGRPYVVPMHYAYDGKDLYFFTTQGMKTQFIEANPQVCLQIEEVNDSTRWRSVMVIGRANELTTSDEMQRAPIAFELVSFDIEASNVRAPLAKVSVRMPDDAVVNGSFTGDGPIDAFFSAINAATNHEG